MESRERLAHAESEFALKKLRQAQNLNVLLHDAFETAGNAYGDQLLRIELRRIDVDAWYRASLILKAHLDELGLAAPVGAVHEDVAPALDQRQHFVNVRLPVLPRWH